MGSPLLAMALTLLLTGAVRSDPRSSSEVQVDWSALTVDELIESLPPVGEESTSDPYDLAAPTVQDPVVTEFARRIRDCEPISAEQWYRALTRTNALRLPSQWPAGERYAVGMRVPEWLPRTQLVLRATDSPYALAEAYGGSNPDYRGCAKGMSGIPRAQAYREIGRIPPGEHVLQFDLEFVVGSASPGVRDIVSEVIRFPHTVLVSNDVPAVPDAFDSSELDSAVRRSLRVTSVDDEDGEVYCMSLVFDPQGADRDRLANVALSFDVQLVHAGEVVLRRPLDPVPFPRDSRDTFLEFGLVGCFLDDLPKHELEEPAVGDEWELVVTGVGRDDELDWDREVVWRGEVRLSATELRRQELALPTPDVRPIAWFVRYAWS